MRSSLPLQVVEGYLDALARRDFDAIRGLLVDEGFSYTSPIATFDSADDLVTYLTIVSGIVQGVECRKVFVDGPDVCHFLVYTTQLAEKQQTQVVQWAAVEGERIRRVELLFDAHQYKIMFGQPASAG